MRYDVFKLGGAMRRSMICKDAFARAVSDLTAFGVGEVKQDICNIMLVAGKQNLLSGREKFVESFPVIRKNRSTTSRCLKQSY
jgi:hypothetical protein